jgi:hypothetical protein
MKRLMPGLAGVIACAVTGCGPLPNPGARQVPDLRPPSLESVQSIAVAEVELSFDEEAELVPEAVRVQPDLAVTRLPPAGTRVVLGVKEQEPGRRYTLEASARDGRGNTTVFAADFYGYNPRVPALLLNEFTPRGSTSHPDVVELRVLAAGDMGGVVFTIGAPQDCDARYVFPSFPVGAGDYILLHFTDEVQDGEVDEFLDRTASRGPGASDAAFDFWIRGTKGLPGNNGILALARRPGGAVMDAVLYSNRTSASDGEYRGFGSARMLARAEAITALGAWKASGARIAPEDAVNPEGSTSTRSLCRSSASQDTDAREDWHIVPTRRSSFGSVNSDELYVSGK